MEPRATPMPPTPARTDGTAPGDFPSDTAEQRCARGPEATGAVERWFGERFATLHPALQRLHREGGRLAGALDVHCGRGLAGLAGRRLARRLGLQPGAANRIEVDIHSDAGTLYWDRVMNGGHRFASRFVPVGCAPDGHWRESTGALTLLLGVEVIDAGTIRCPDRPGFPFR
jgi:hypothetical protein